MTPENTVFLVIGILLGIQLDRIVLIPKAARMALERRRHGGR